MKRKLLFLLPIVSMSLSACLSGGVKHEKAIYKMNHLNNPSSQQIQYIELAASSLVNMVNNKMTFPVIFTSSGCSLCENAKACINNYIVSYNNVTIYTVELNSSSSTIIKSMIPEFSNIQLQAPSMYLIKEGKINYQFDNQHLTSKPAFRNEADKMFIDSSVYYAGGSDVIWIGKEFMRKFDNYLIIITKSTNSNSMRFLGDHILPYAYDYKYPTLIFSQEDAIKVGQKLYFGEGEDAKILSDSLSVYKVDFNELKSQSNYSTSSLDADVVVKSFFGLQ